MEKSNESKYPTQDQALQNKVIAGNKVSQGKIYARSQVMDGNMHIGSGQRKVNSSRLDAMKRQFHKKVSKSSMATSNRNTPSTSPKKTNPYLEASENIPQVKMYFSLLLHFSSNLVTKPFTLLVGSMTERVKLPFLQRPCDP